MLFFVLRRLLLMVPTTIGIALVVFVIFHAAPGDPATVMIGAGTGGQLGQNSDVEGASTSSGASTASTAPWWSSSSTTWGP